MAENKSIPTDIDFINLDDISTAPPVFAPGPQHCKIIELELRENKAKDGFYINYRIVIQSGEHAGASLFCMWSLKENAAWRMKKDFKAIGYTPANGKPHLADLQGFEGIAEVIIQPAKGEYDEKNVIGRWLGPLK